MIIVRASKDSEAGQLPSTELLAAMGKYNEELAKAGVMVAGEGLHASSKGARVKFSGTDRTVTPFDIYPAFTKLSRTIQDLDTKSLSKSFEVLAQDFQGTPNEVRPVIDGLSRLSDTIASRDAALQELLARTNQVTGTLAARDQDLTQLIRDGNLLLEELNARTSSSNRRKS